MEHRRTDEVPATTCEVLDYLTCDLCGARSAYGAQWDGRAPLRSAGTALYVEWGGGTRDGSGFSNRLECHVCPDCMRERVFPWLRSQGATPTETADEF